MRHNLVFGIYALILSFIFSNHFFFYFSICQYILNGINGILILSN